jgi:tyrosinase
MNVEIEFSGIGPQDRAFLTWRPIKVSLKLVGAPVLPANVEVTLAGQTKANGGRLSFAITLTHNGADTIDVSLPSNGQATEVWVGGKAGFPSISFGDVALEVRVKADGALLGSRDTMVRIRKDANVLTAAERDRFLSALATLNGNGMGRFKDFRDMHVGGAPDKEAHGGPAFTAWHRAYLLDLERELQAIDDTMALPYWRFDKAAPNLFKREFIGVPDSAEQVQFSPGHPLLNWVTDGVPGIWRRGAVGPNTVPNVLSEAGTLGLGGSSNPNFARFRAMQGNPHGAAHMSNGNGWITNISTAPKDPLFFLLHCNVDRLWAKWQFVAGRSDPADARSFDESPNSAAGHRINDRMWPWSGPLPAPRPTTAPGGGLAASPITAAPGVSPRVSDMIDYFGTTTGTHLAFAYDDVPFFI